MSLLDHVEAGDVGSVIRALASMTPAQRSDYSAILTARRSASDLLVEVGCPTCRVDAHLAAELGCLDSASSAAEQIRALEQRRRLSDMTDEGAWLPAVVDQRSVEWRVELVERLSEYDAGWQTFGFAFLEHLVHSTGCPVPTTDGFLTAWLRDREHWSPYRASHLKGGIPFETGLRRRLLADPWTPRLLPLALERPGAELPLMALAEVSDAEPGLVDRAVLARRCFDRLPHAGRWVWNLVDSAELTADERARVATVRVELLDQCLDHLLQDGTRRDLEPWFERLAVLAPTPAERAASARDHVALLDGSPPVAAYAQEVLAALDEAGLIEPDLVSEASERVLLRSEKKLVRDQLLWLDKAARRDPARAGQVVLSAAVAFDNRDAALQERALVVIARHLKAAGEAVLPNLRTAAGRLGPMLSERAAELFGPLADVSVERVVDLLPGSPEPSLVPGPVATAAEVAEEVAAVLAGDRDVVAFERALDGLVRHTNLDRAALAVALEPVTRKEPRQLPDHRPIELYDVARAVRGEAPRTLSAFTTSPPTLAGDVLLARMTEAADAVRSGTLPFLLAVPTLTTGALDAAILVDRLATYEELDVIPGPVDQAQALLRVTSTADPQVLAAAGKLSSDAGKRVARWLRTGGLPHQDSTPESWDPHTTSPRWQMLRAAAHGLTVDSPLPAEVAALIGPYSSQEQSDQSPQAFWIAQLPHHRDMVAARQYCTTRSTDFGVLSLRFLVAADGPAGYAVHMALAWGLVLHRPQHTDLAADAVLTLAARGQLDAVLLGQQIALLANEGLGRRDGLVTVLRTMATMGAPGLVWSILGSALRILLRGKLSNRVGALLALAVECASPSGASGEIAEVTEVAERQRASLVVKYAKALRDVLS